MQHRSSQSHECNHCFKLSYHKTINVNLMLIFRCLVGLICCRIILTVAELKEILSCCSFSSELLPQQHYMICIVHTDHTQVIKMNPKGQVGTFINCFFWQNWCSVGLQIMDLANRKAQLTNFRYTVLHVHVSNIIFEFHKANFYKANFYKKNEKFT